MKGSLIFLTITVITSCIISYSLANEKIDISGLAWKNRILIIHRTGDGKALMRIKPFDPEEKCEIDERKIEVIIFINEENSLYEMPKFALNKSGIWLLGYDGSQKYFTSKTLDLKKIFDVIDLMPMRQEEISKTIGSC